MYRSPNIGDAVGRRWPTAHRASAGPTRTSVPRSTAGRVYPHHEIKVADVKIVDEFPMPVTDKVRKVAMSEMSAAERGVADT